MDKLNLKNLPRMIDISCVRTDVTISELELMVELTKKHKLICCYAMPSFMPWLARKIANEDYVKLGGVVGFPSGAVSTASKLLDVKEGLSLGCGELDMVINVGALKSGKYDYVAEDIKAVVDEANGIPVITILEVAYLTDYEIQKGSEIAVEAGVTFVKTGTGWANKPTVLDHIKLIKSVVGNKAKVKAAGGVRGLKTISEMVDAGCERFGIGSTDASIFSPCHDSSHKIS